MSKKQRSNPPSKNKNQPQADQQQQNQQQQLIKAEQFSGPVPHPEILRQYDEILPGAAERILSMAESESEHQKDMDKTAIHLKSQENKRGQIFALITVILAFSTATACAYLGATTPAGIIGGTTVVGLVAVFITGRSKNSQE
ncbi:MAG: DUF2335 domain-containing protein [Desulfobacteraceae bacterium]|nr:DUF2335 domain-containing protein [Desulfobacteraceae bacterium]